MRIKSLKNQQKRRDYRDILQPSLAQSRSWLFWGRIHGILFDFLQHTEAIVKKPQDQYIYLLSKQITDYFIYNFKIW